MSDESTPKADDNRVSRRRFIQRVGTGLLAGAVAGSLPNGLARAQEESWDQETDVLILGSGAAGLAAALAAREAGSRVTVLERYVNPGGSSRRSGGVLYLGGGTAVQLANGFQDTPENMYDYLLAAMGPGGDEPRIRAYCDGSVELFDWLSEQGVPFNDKYTAAKVPQPMGDETLFYSGSERSYPYSQLADAYPRGHKVGAPGSAAYVMMDILQERAIAAGVEFRFGVRALNLIRKDDRVVGVRAAYLEEEEREETFHATAGVIVATGGFQFNEELVSLHCPEYLKAAAPLGAPGEDGDGLTMGQRIGGQVMNLAHASPWKFMYPPDAMVKSLLVSPLGTRFITEDIYGGNASRETVINYDSISYLIYDEAIKQEIGEHADRLQPIAQADSIEELAAQLDIEPSVLANTFAYYNEQAAHGRDPLFHKAAEYVQPLATAPYYALDFSGMGGGMSWITLGGLRTDVHSRVYNVDDGVIPGLYAAGRASAALGTVYNSGTSLGDCLFFGRVAGQHAAARVAGSARREVAVAGD